MNSTTGVFIIPCAILLLYIALLWRWKSPLRKLPENFLRYEKRIHYLFLSFTLFLFLIDICFRISLSSQLATEIIIVGFILTGITIPLARKERLNKFEKIYFSFFSGLFIAFTLLIIIPFLGQVFLGYTFGDWLEPQKKYYEDKNIKIESTYLGIMAPKDAGSQILAKEGIFERKLFLGRTDRPDSLKVEYDKDSTRIYFYFSYDRTPRKITIEKAD